MGVLNLKRVLRYINIQDMIDFLHKSYSKILCSFLVVTDNSKHLQNMTHEILLTCVLLTLKNVLPPLQALISVGARLSSPSVWSRRHIWYAERGYRNSGLRFFVTLLKYQGSCTVSTERPLSCFLHRLTFTLEMRFPPEDHWYIWN